MINTNSVNLVTLDDIVQSLLQDIEFEREHKVDLVAARQAFIQMQINHCMPDFIENAIVIEQEPVSQEIKQIVRSMQQTEQAKNNQDDSTSNHSGTFSYYQTPNKRQAVSHKSYSSSKGVPSQNYYSNKKSRYGPPLPRKEEGRTLWMKKSDLKMKGVEQYQGNCEPTTRFTSAKKEEKAADDYQPGFSQSNVTGYPIRKNYSQQF